MRILITGGTGSLGRALIRELLYPDEGLPFYSLEGLIAFARSESRLDLLKQEYGDRRPFKTFIGDVRDVDRLKYAFYGVDLVIHAAALKRVDAALYQPMETIKTNALGTWNVIEAAMWNKVKKVIVVSSDKAVEASNIYGVTKAAAEHIAISSNSFAFPQGTSVSVVRYGNVLTSTGSAYWIFKKQLESGLPHFTITDPSMTRFGMTMRQAVQFVLGCSSIMKGGEIFIPRLPSFEVTTLAQAVDPNRPHQVIGKRGGGEKVNEVMISRHEADRTVFYDCLPSPVYIINPSLAEWGYVPWADNLPHRHLPIEPVPAGFSYESNNNAVWLSSTDIQRLLEGELWA